MPEPRLHVAINGAREHPGIPRTPIALAAAARASVAAGAEVVHLHAYDAEGNESFDAAVCDAALRAVRAACPGIPLSLTTSATIEPDPERRLQLVRSWTELPDLVTANQGEAGIVELCEELLARGVEIEAGLLELRDAELFVESGLAPRCRRVLLEPLDPDPDTAVAHAVAMADVLEGISLPQVHHGEGIACWSVNARAAGLGHGIRTGLEDVTVLPDGSPAPDNAALVRAASALLL
ncbi:MAG TPA: 3-keto-5-aminohexanoate cleavage protein [Gaiellaceae bacterium]|nr:3-keto-5-aminohexanoate cleavage protein [Gaiellaceae bacterium]